ncbi:cell death regulator Aven isoform X1 [Pipra filicauda]|uniref:Cell death regulator Aven isoform X1 n=1 Tax=Pipra filicauda TaxID=649802 RepID=A0A7R5KEA1_9PASS|nr:cell death regulator Aven isoform X1 [Pipra filicauda]
MQAERGGSRARREGVRHGRRRPSGAAEAAAEGSGRDCHGPGGGGGRGRGGAYGQRGGGGRGRRQPRGRGAAPPPSAPQHQRVVEDDDAESQPEEEKEELKCYSRRKLFSNWNRYEDTEKEEQNEHGESQRGTDFSVLLSSADTRYSVSLFTCKGIEYVCQKALTAKVSETGDSFTQFRFADEKEWDKESICHKQFSALSVDCQSLVQALQELPLHLKLNVAADLVQASTPVELPQMKSKIFEDVKRRDQLFRQSPAQSDTVLVSPPVGNSVATSEPGSKNGSKANAREPFQRIHPLSKQETDHLDEELDLLLNLEAPMSTGNRPVSGTLSYDISTEKDLKMDCKESDPLKVDMPEEKSTSSQQQQSTSKDVTEEELEDWLDSMIS